MDNLRLTLQDEKLRPLLLTGLFERRHGWVATEVKDNQVTFNLHTSKPPALVLRCFKAIRAISLTATLMPAVAALLALAILNYSIDYVVVALAILAMLFLQISVNVFNDVEDYLKLIDLPGSLGGSGVIQQAWFTASQLRVGAWTCLIIAIIFASPAVLKAPEYTLVCAGLAGLGVLGYSGKPFEFKYRGLGDVFVFLLCGPVLTLGVGLAATGNIVLELMVVGAFFGLLACGILNANNINDIEIDTARGGKTLASILGFKSAKLLQLSYYLGALLSLVYLAMTFSNWLMLPFIATPLIGWHFKRLLSAQKCDEPSLANIRFEGAKLHLLFSVLFCIALVLELSSN